MFFLKFFVFVFHVIFSLACFNNQCHVRYFYVYIYVCIYVVIYVLISVNTSERIRRYTLKFVEHSKRLLIDACVCIDIGKILSYVHIYVQIYPCWKANSNTIHYYRNLYTVPIKTRSIRSTSYLTLFTLITWLKSLKGTIEM